MARNSKHDEVALRRKVVVTGGSSLCGSHLINRGITQTGRNVTIEFTGTGPRTGFTCRLDRKKSYSCKCNDMYKTGTLCLYRQQCTLLLMMIYCSYSQKLSREKTFTNWWKIRLSRRELSQIATKSQNSRRFSPSKVSCYLVLYTLSFSRLSLVH